MKKITFNKYLACLCLIFLLAAGCSLKKTTEVKPAVVPAPSAPQAVTDPPAPFAPTLSERLPVKEPATTTKDSAKTPTPKPPTPPPLPQECNNSNYECYQTYYQDLVKNFGVDVTFATIRKQEKTDNYVRTECHALTHIIGQAATGVYATVSEAYAHGDEFCSSGYYHGVMEGVINKLGRDKVPDALNNMCADIPGKERYSLDYFNCNHGLGHGVMGFTNNELFDSLVLCDRLNGSWEQSSCYGGVFMENVIADFRNHFTKYLKPEDPMYPCGAVGQKYKQSCYLIQSSYVLKVTGSDFKKTFEACEKIEPEFQATCFQSVGRDASGTSVSNVQLTKTRCEMGKDYFQQSNCIIGATKDFVWHFHSEEEGKKLCAALAPDLQDICYSTAKSYYESF